MNQGSLSGQAKSQGEEDFANGIRQKKMCLPNQNWQYLQTRKRKGRPISSIILLLLQENEVLNKITKGLEDGESFSALR